MHNNCFSLHFIQDPKTISKWKTLPCGEVLTPFGDDEIEVAENIGIYGFGGIRRHISGRNEVYTT